MVRLGRAVFLQLSAEMEARIGSFFLSFFLVLIILMNNGSLFRYYRVGKLRLGPGIAYFFFAYLGCQHQEPTTSRSL